MSVIQLDVKKFESGLGFGDVQIVTGKPFAAAVERTAALNASPSPVLGNSDGYDLTNGTSLRVYFDVVMGAGTYVDLLIRPIAANIGRVGGKEMVPEAIADVAQSGFDPYLVVLAEAAGPLKIAPGKIRFEAAARGSFTIGRNAALFQFVGVSDAADGAIAVAVQSILEPGGE